MAKLISHDQAMQFTFRKHIKNTALKPKIRWRIYKRAVAEEKKDGETLHTLCNTDPLKKRY